jgi:hypothetical protein
MFVSFDQKIFKHVPDEGLPRVREPSLRCRLERYVLQRKGGIFYDTSFGKYPEVQCWLAKVLGAGRIVWLL